MLPARKRFGQNFLHDANVIRRILAAIAPATDEHFLEIGGGLGALTIPLAPLVDRLDVVEIDPRLADALALQLSGSENVTVHNADALSFDVAACAGGDGMLRVAGNLPYNISTPLLFYLAGFRQLILDMHFMLQKEVVDRMVAQPGSKSYGRLTVMLARWFDITACFDIRPGSFRPQPRVMSTLARLVVRREARFPVVDEQHFAALVAHLFSMRRKTLGRALRGRVSPEALGKLGIDPMARAETLSPGRLAELSNATQQH
jgi:16S rRNA (adenine1518-N6/adenine1519-N6)-dimethyltransferase